MGWRKVRGEPLPNDPRVVWACYPCPGVISTLPLTVFSPDALIPANPASEHLVSVSKCVFLKCLSVSYDILKWFLEYFIWLQGKAHGNLFFSQNTEHRSCSVVSDSLQPHGLYPPGSSVHGIFQAWILEWVAISFSRKFLPKLWPSQLLVWFLPIALCP